MIQAYIRTQHTLRNSNLTPRLQLTANMSSTTKKARTHPSYELLYHPSIPGRGEFIRLAFEATHTPYTDVANEENQGTKAVYALTSPDSTGDADGNPPPFAPPMLRVPGEGKNGKALLVYQTPAILSYLGGKLGLAGDDEAEGSWVLAHALTALDLNNEAHDTHHPVAVGSYYEDQKEESLRKASDFRENRVPKFLGFFERVLKGNEGEGEGKFLVGGKLSYADTTVWHVLSGLFFAFPKEMEARKKDYPLLFEAFFPGVEGHAGVKEYLASERRKPFNMGVFRHYPELDRQ